MKSYPFFHHISRRERYEWRALRICVCLKSPTREKKGKKKLSEHHSMLLLVGVNLGRTNGGRREKRNPRFGKFWVFFLWYLRDGYDEGCSRTWSKSEKEISWMNIDRRPGSWGGCGEVDRNENDKLTDDFTVVQMKHNFSSLFFV